MIQTVTNFLSSDYLALALAEAKTRRGFCAPNPAVGAVVVKEGQVLSVGSHWAAGEPHAEVDALKALSQEQSRGASLYVTLEPCCHFGKTPPCTDLIIQREIAEVYYAYADPNPLVAGKGEVALKAAGLKCVHAPLPEIDEFYRSYRYWQMHRRPWVSAKLALSLDGKIAAADGRPVQITGLECQRLTHESRCASDAILSTAETVLADNPQFNVRLEKTISKPIYILDRRLRLSGEEKIFKTAARLTIFHARSFSEESRKNLEKKGAHCVALNEVEEGLDLNAALDFIGQEGQHDLWLEAGGKIFYQFYIQNLIHRALIYLSPKTLGQDAKLAFPNSFDLRKSGLSTRMFTCGEDVVWELIIGA